MVTRLAREATGSANYNATVIARRGTPEVSVTSNSRAWR